jgi:hypothetical protein
VEERLDFEPPERRPRRVTPRRKGPDPKQVRLGLAALLVVALVIFGLVKLLGGDDNGGGGSSNVGPVAVSESKLASKAGDVDHPVYWVGTEPGIDQYEFTSTEDGRVYVRYLTQGAEAGDERSSFLTVGTYSVPNAQDALQTAADAGGKAVQPGQGFSLLESPNGKSTYVVLDDQPDLQIEIYDPKPGNALKLAQSQALRPLN